MPPNTAPTFFGVSPVLSALRNTLIRTVSGVLVISAWPHATSAQYPSDWTAPFPAFRVTGNLYYVGSQGLASYLITTAEGHILINSNLESSVPQLRESVESLGFKFADIKILLISHAHWDHDAGSAAIKAMTGARYFVMDADVPVVESGGRSDYQYGSTPSAVYPPTTVDRVLHDREEVRLGDVTLIAHLTPGHTKGCTTWSLRVRNGTQELVAVIVGSPNVNPGTSLVRNAAYPQIQADYEMMFRRLRELPADIFLGSHGGYFGLEGKYAQMQQGVQAPFVDPEGYRRYVASKEAAFRAELARQLAAPPQ